MQGDHLACDVGFLLGLLLLWRGIGTSAVLDLGGSVPVLLGEGCKELCILPAAAIQLLMLLQESPLCLDAVIFVLEPLLVPELHLVLSMLHFPHPELQGIDPLLQLVDLGVLGEDAGDYTLPVRQLLLSISQLDFQPLVLGLWVLCLDLHEPGPPREVLVRPLLWPSLIQVLLHINMQED